MWHFPQINAFYKPVDNIIEQPNCSNVSTDDCLWGSFETEHDMPCMLP